MADMLIQVNAAVTLPVNKMPLLDDTDFKTRETAVAYNASGMDLVWNFTTFAGVTSQTAVTPSNSGNYLWTHSGDGMYRIQMPASGGASISNNAVGFGWFSGIATGVLPWISPIFQFAPADANTLLADPTTGLVAIYDIVNNPQLSDATKKDIADKLLGRSIAGGADGGRTVSQALMRLRNRNALSGSAGDTSRTLTVYQNDDSTTSFTAAVTLDAGGGHPSNVDPA